MDRHDPHPSLEQRLDFRQWLAGRDFAKGDPIATQMANFTYLIADRVKQEAVLVDPCYAVGELVDLAEAAGYRITGALATHYHQDHVGGDLFGHALQGVRELLTRCPCKVHVQRDEVPWVKRVTGCGDGDLAPHHGGDVLHVGQIPITLLHTPGHTPGSQCFLVAGRLVAGDTLFLQGCGRTDFPGGDPKQLYRSLTQVLAQVPDDTVLYPGHAYDPRGHATMGSTRQSNMVFQPKSEADWLRSFAR